VSAMPTARRPTLTPEERAALAAWLRSKTRPPRR